MNTPAKLLPANAWKIKQSLDLYQVEAWGKGYFSINDAGHVVIRPSMDAAREIDLYDVVQGLKARDLHTPVVIRFSDILAHRLRHLAEAFGTAIAENEYRNRYAAVFPIKVNQHRLVVCNGFKDDSYLEAVIIAAKLGRTIIPVVENFVEIHAILKHAERYGVRPRIGVRVKLARDGAGRWRDSAGEKSKFGLFISEILDLHALLRERNMLDCLQLVHCHPGSQLQDIRRVKDAINELAHVYAELKIMGAGLKYIDIGGGLGVDYDGSGTNYESSMNYTLNEYAGDVVYRIKSVCDARNVPHPMIVSESGRAIAAHHSLLVFDTLGSSKLDQFKVSGRPEEDYRGAEELPQPVLDLFDAYRSVNERRLVECYHDALQAREQALQMFNLGYLSLEFRGLAERLYWATCAKIRDYCRKLDRVPEELDNIEDMLSDIYFCNFSIFQSLPDSWAIGQVFPIMPIQRLGERPTRNAVLADITCDSDGKIDKFVHPRITKRTLEVHELNPGEPYYLATFLVGAYQETLGDLHNLFGDTHVVHIRLQDDGGWWIEEIVKGDTANKVLEYMEYDTDELYPGIARDCERAVQEGRMSLSEAQAVKRFYENELNGYAYLEVE